MDNIFARTGFEVPEQVRRFLQGESETGLRIEEYRDGTTLVVRTDLPGIDPRQTSRSPSPMTPCTSKPGARTPATGTDRDTAVSSDTGSSPAAYRCPAGPPQKACRPATSTAS